MPKAEKRDKSQSSQPEPTPGHKLLVSSSAMAAVATHAWGDKVFAKTDIVGLIEEVARVSKEVKNGDMEMVERMLVGQAIALQAMFTQLSHRAVAQEYLKQFQVYTSLSLKAQAACRQTLEALAEIKNPRPVVYGQANIAQNQQINQGTPPQPTTQPPTPAALAHGENRALENELFAAPRTPGVATIEVGA